MSILLDIDEIYSAVVQGFATKVKADGLTDEIALKRHESARQVAKDQARKIALKLKGIYGIPDLKMEHDRMGEFIQELMGDMEL